MVLVKRVVLPPYDSFGLSTFVICDKMVFLSHFGGIFDENGKILGTVEQQTEQCLRNIERNLKTINLGLKNLVKITVILKDTKDFLKMHDVWKKFFVDEYPVRTTITSDFVDDSCLIQMDGVACYE